MAEKPSTLGVGLITINFSNCNSVKSTAFF